MVAGGPIHCPVPGPEQRLLGRAAMRTTLEGAKAIALSHHGTLFIAETDERRINRIQQVAMPPMSSSDLSQVSCVQWFRNQFAVYSVC